MRVCQFRHLGLFGKLYRSLNRTKFDYSILPTKKGGTPLRERLLYTVPPLAGLGGPSDLSIKWTEKTAQTFRVSGDQKPQSLWGLNH